MSYSSRNDDKKDWVYEVANGDTSLGFDDWRSHKWEAEGKNNEGVYNDDVMEDAFFQLAVSALTYSGDKGISLDDLFAQIKETIDLNKAVTNAAKRYNKPSDFEGEAIWVCTEPEHEEFVYFTTVDKDHQDVNDCPTCKHNVFESDRIFPLFLTQGNGE